MTAPAWTPARFWIAAVVIAVLAGASGYGLARFQKSDARSAATTVAAAPRKILYYYDPMSPEQHFDKPGKSPFMDMQLMPRYADGGADGGTQAAAPGVKIDQAIVQNLGVRLASVQRGDFAQTIDAAGVVDFNQRDVAVVQARASGFVQRVYGRAPGDVIAAGAPLADLLVPSWGGAQAEFLAVRATGDRALEDAARKRLRLLGMSENLIEQVARTGRARDVVTVVAPTGGALQSLDVRQGMTVGAGQTLAQVSGLSTVWLNAAVPEAMAGQVQVGSPARAELTAFPGETFSGKIAAILPSAQADSRTLTVRIELPNKAGRLRPGMFAAVHLGGAARSALFVPSEAVIRTGTRALVMLAGEGGRFQPTQVRIGRDGGDRTEILAGLQEGQKIVASGQFLLDSEASLTGLQATPLGAEPMTASGSRR